MRARARSELVLQLANEACVLICRTLKPADRKGKVLFINAVNEVARKSAQSFLKPEHQSKILAAYQEFSDRRGFASVAKTEDILAMGGALSIPKHVEKATSAAASGVSLDLSAAWDSFEEDTHGFWNGMDSLVEMLDGIVVEEASDA